MKHAYLILAHNEWDILKLLISRLDDERNDIYVHFDKKVKMLPQLETRKSSLTILQERVDVYWGDVSVVEAEYRLYEEASAHGPYAYYHLLSGVDLPLKSQDYIHDFCDKWQGKQFIGYTLTEITPEIVAKTWIWHLFPHSFKKKNVLRSIFKYLQYSFKKFRNTDVDFKKGSQWCSITEDLVKYVLDHKEWVEKTFTHTFCADEIFIQTLCWMSPYRGNIFNDTDDGKGCARAIGWQGSQLIDWSRKDFAFLKNCDALFARKFNSQDMDFIHEVLKMSE